MTRGGRSRVFSAGRGPRVGDMMPGARIHDNDEWAGGLAMMVAEKHHRAGRLIYFHGDPDQIVLVLQKWLDPERPPRPGTGRDPVMDALAAARLLEYRWIHKLAPSLMPWLCFDRYHMRVRQLEVEIGRASCRERV